MTCTESTNQRQPLTLDSLHKSMEELNKHNVSLYRSMALSSIDIIPDPKLPEGYWCIRCSPDVYLRIQIEIDKINEEENNGYRKD